MNTQDKTPNEIANASHGVNKNQKASAQPENVLEFESHFHECAKCGKIGATRFGGKQWWHDMCAPETRKESDSSQIKPSGTVKQGRRPMFKRASDNDPNDNYAMYEADRVSKREATAPETRDFEAMWRKSNAFAKLMRHERDEARAHAERLARRLAILIRKHDGASLEDADWQLACNDLVAWEGAQS